jgi:spore germination protein KA
MEINGVWKYLKTKLNIWASSEKPNGIGDSPAEYTQFKDSLDDNMTIFLGSFNGCADFVQKEFTVCGKKAAVFYIDNMVDKVALTQCVMGPLTTAITPSEIANDEAQYKWLRDCVLSAVDQREIFTVEECQWAIMTGFVCVLIDGINKALLFGLQVFPYRSVAEPDTDKALRGSREGFIEPLHLNISIMRRRMKNSNLKFESYQLGKESKTEVCLTYIKGIVSESVLDSVRHRLKTIDIDTVLESGYIQIYFQDHPYSIFPTAGYTERPDTLLSKLNEGKVGIMVDGTPVAIYVPHIFAENFQNMDDYSVGAWYATLTRVLKFTAFFISVMLPGLYVAVGSFHQSLLPSELLHALAQAEEGTPFPLIVEALLMQVIYEILREAGLRTPQKIGTSLTIVGAFLIGQAAVSANLIGAPMVIIVSLTATTALVVPTLYEPGVIMRFVFIIVAGMCGIYGVTLAFAFFVIHMCSIKTYDVPYTAPLMPLDVYSLRDVIVRAPWLILSRKKNKVQDMPGSDAEKTLE